MRYLFLLLWFITLVLGATIATIVPEHWIYITGYITGIVSVMFLDISDMFKRK